ncbi:hypothetical protein UY3_02288 [Chelonia mydas]|uniref:Uncharacterized protein n=1 Tax=Chelonia mydas TaxID=8469 RepID=M7C7E1_CHEMY|nr:hypothetical protein UY3_02288 [Chelonia mydas]
MGTKEDDLLLPEEKLMEMDKRAERKCNTEENWYTIQNRLVKAIAPRLGEVTKNCAIPGTDSQLRPDVDPGEARARKLEKYAPLANTLRVKGYEVQMDALIVGALSTWDPCNERVPQTCGICRCYTWLMRRLMVSDTIRWPRDIYIEHITGPDSTRRCELE